MTHLRSMDEQKCWCHVGAAGSFLKALMPQQGALQVQMHAPISTAESAT